MFSGDPEDRFILTEHFQHHSLGARSVQHNAPAGTTCAAGGSHLLTH